MRCDLTDRPTDRPNYCTLLHMRGGLIMSMIGTTLMYMYMCVLVSRLWPECLTQNTIVPRNDRKCTIY